MLQQTHSKYMADLEQYRADRHVVQLISDSSAVSSKAVCLLQGQLPVGKLVRQADRCCHTVILP